MNDYNILDEQGLEDLSLAIKRYVAARIAEQKLVIDGIDTNATEALEKATETESSFAALSAVIDSMFELINGRINAKYNFIGSGDITANGQIVGKRGVAAMGIASTDVVTGGEGQSYTPIAYEDIPLQNVEHTDVLPTAYALNMVLQALEREITERKAEDKTLDTFIKNVRRTGIVIGSTQVRIGDTVTAEQLKEILSLGTASRMSAEDVASSQALNDEIKERKEKEKTLEDDLKSVATSLGLLGNKVDTMQNPITEDDFDALPAKEKKLYFVTDNKGKRLMKIYYGVTMIARRKEGSEAVSFVFPATFPMVFG